MRKTWLIFINSMQRMRMVVFASLAIGVVLCLLTTIFSSLAPSLTSNIKIGYLNHDGSALASDFELYVTQNLGMELVEGDQEYLNNELVDKNISAIVKVPAGFEQSVVSGNNGALQVTYIDDYVNKIFLQNYLEMYTDSVQMLASAAQGDVNSFESLLDAASGESAPVTTAASDQQTSLRNQKWTAFTVGSGFFLFISGMLIVTVASIIYEDKVNNTFTRVQATNVSSVAYVIGVSVAGFVSLMVMVAVYLVYCAVSGLGEIVALPEFGLLCALFVCLCVGFAMVCGLVLKSRSAILWSAVALSTICSLMGGAWFPINYAPDFMQQLAHITPQFWFIDALSQMHDGYAQAWITSTVVIGLYALLCFLIVGIRFASNKSSA